MASKLEDDISAETWDAWNKLLSPISLAQLGATKAQRAAIARSGGATTSDELLAQLHPLAVELRDRLRFSQRRCGQLKSELRALRDEAARTAADAARSIAHTQDSAAHAMAAAQADAAQAAAAAQDGATRAVAAARDEAARAVAAARDEAARAVTAAREEAARAITATREDAARAVAAAQQEANSIVATVRAEAAQERTRMAAQLSAFEAEVARMSQGVQGQVVAMSSQETLIKELQAESSSLRQQLRTAAAQAEDGMQRAQDAEAARDHMFQELESLRACADEACALAAHHEKQQADLTDALLATKGRVRQLHSIEGLYVTARDELSRLDKENQELKEMMESASAGVTLGRSRILETLTSGRSKSTPLHLSPEATGKKSSKKKGGAKMLTSAAAAASGLWGGPTTSLTNSGVARIFASGGSGKGGELVLAAEDSAASYDPLSDLAFLGPPTSAYPPDPEKFVYLRVAGGYAPKLAGVEELPKASGWVPKAVVRLVQAFRHAYGIDSPDWPYWEPLLLMIDEVYRSRTGSNTAAVKSASKDKIKTLRRQLAAAVSYPSVLQAGRISALKRQLETVRKSLAARDGRDDAVLRTMAEKEFHITHQLDAAIDENLALRRSLQQLDEELYVQEQQQGGVQGYGLSGGAPSSSGMGYTTTSYSGGQAGFSTPRT